VNDYQPDLINGDYCALLNSTELQSKEFLAWLYTDSPVKDQVVVDDRWVIDMLACLLVRCACLLADGDRTQSASTVVTRYMPSQCAVYLQCRLSSLVITIVIPIRPAPIVTRPLLAQTIFGRMR